uniref:Uncharacterized protein n=1 Tax=viral metagenome TaxID=1070528 RepID=A0A6M3LP22_9ZZZZ
MDTSETYIKMCTKAGELQATRVLEIGDYYAYRNKFGYLVIGSDSFPETTKQIFIGGCIWLPRQDQLQEMIQNQYGQLGKLSPFGICQKIYKFAGATLISQDLMSMEQLWLAFVMKEKCNKIWNGTDWK